MTIFNDDHINVSKTTNCEQHHSDSSNQQPPSMDNSQNDTVPQMRDVKCNDSEINQIAHNNMKSINKDK